MVEDSGNIVFEHLRALHRGMDDLQADMRDVKSRLTSLEASQAILHGDLRDSRRASTASIAGWSGSRIV